MKCILSLVALAAAALCALAPAAANPVLTFVPSSNTVAVANSITVDANVSGLGTDILSGFDLNFVYNPALLKMATVQCFSANLGGGSGLLLDGIQGNIGLKDISADPDVVLAAIQPDAFTLFTFTLLGLDHGATTFTLGPDATFDRKFLGLMDARGDRAS